MANFEFRLGIACHLFSDQQPYIFPSTSETLVRHGAGAISASRPPNPRQAKDRDGRVLLGPGIGPPPSTSRRCMNRRRLFCRRYGWLIRGTDWRDAWERCRGWFCWRLGYLGLNHDPSTIAHSGIAQAAYECMPSRVCLLSVDWVEVRSWG